MKGFSGIVLGFCFALPCLCLDPICPGYGSLMTDTDIAGREIRQKKGNTTDCCFFCNEESACEGFSFFDGLCYLKTDVNGTYANKGRVTGQKSRPTNCDGFSPIQVDVDLVGILIKTVYVPSEENCCDACTKTSGCEGFTAVEGMCYLKGQLKGTYSHPGRQTQCINQCPGGKSYVV